ncbi:MAG: hypothetical protein LBD22_03730 [Spirochaetaceae bacterium]|jgi:hypothetical protein|nr:hypothetical protein [Spirochaetaceae bacterium]
MLKKLGYGIIIFCVTLPAGGAVPPDAQWYISNGSGMFLEKTFKARALRSEFAVSVQNVKPENAPAELRKYYTAPWTIECRVLYEKGSRIRTQWVFQDVSKTSFLVAAISNDGSGFIEWYDDKGFIVEEQRLAADGSGFFVTYTYRDMFLLKAEAHIVEPVKKPESPAEEPKTDDKAAEEPKPASAAPAGAATPDAPASADGTVQNTGENGQLAADTGGEKPNGAEETGDAAPAEISGSTDTAAAPAPPTEEGAPAAEEQAAAPPPSPPPPPPKPASSRVRNPDGPLELPEYFVAATGKEGPLLWTDNYRYTRSLALRAIERVYHDPKAEQKLARINFPKYAANSQRQKDFVSPGTTIASEFLHDIFIKEASKVTYTTDARRRIVSEIRKNPRDEVIGELINTWDGDRVSKVTWISENDERVIEFSYNKSGDRIAERDYRNGVLERMVTIDKEQEIEELYLNNELALRAIWQKGKKISEERILNRRLR